MTARRLMVVLAGSFMLVPLALAQDRAVSRSGAGGGSAHSSSGSVQATGSTFSGGSSATDAGSWSSQAQPVAFARDHAVSRGGGSSSSSRGGSSSSSGSSSASSSRGGSSSSSSDSAQARGRSSSSSSRTRHPKPSTAAERRHPRAGTSRSGGGYYSGRGDYYYAYPHSYGYYYPGWGWGSYWWPYGSYYDGWYGGGYWGHPYGGWATRSYVRRDIGSVRVLVDPAEARVYVDGYYAGTVDDFDGLFQRLNVSPGRHEITLKLEGYKTHRVKVYVPFDGTLKLHYDLEKGAGETFEDRAANVPERELQRERELLREQELLREREREDESAQENESDEAPGPATLRLSVSPPDASVYIDGAFRGTAREAASIQLPPGRHKIEVVRPGYRTVEREVETAEGEPTELRIELDKTSI